MFTEPGFWAAAAYGLVGSILVEVILLTRAIGPRGGVPVRFKSFWHWVPRVVIAMCSAIVATAYYNQNLPFYLYVHLGAATPAILLKASQVDDDEDIGDVKTNNGKFNLLLGCDEILCPVSSSFATVFTYLS